MEDERKIKKLLFYHNCALTPPEDIVIRYIDSGCCVDSRRRFRKLLMVSDNPRSKTYLKSAAAIRQERERHLQHNYHMIHPFSDGRAYYEYFMMFVLLIMLIIIPVEISTMKTVWFIKITKFILDLLCIMDVCVTFATGYYQHSTKKIILNPKRVARNYIFGYFIIDVVTSIPVDIVLTIMGKGEDLWFIKLLTYVKVLRFTTLIKYMKSFRDHQQYSIYKFKVFLLSLSFFLGILWSSSIILVIARTSQNSWLLPEERKGTFQGFIRSTFRSVTIILLVTYATKRSRVEMDMIFEICGLTVGILLQLYMLAQILQALNKHNSSSNKYQHLMQQLNEYMRYKELPDIMRRRILSYFDFRYQKIFFKESEILGTLSAQLRQEIIMNGCKRLVENVHFFRALPTSLLARIVTSMKSEIFLPNDSIVQAGTAGESMFFISSGTVAVYTSNGKEVCHLADGAHFGEIALVMENETRVASVVAVDCCELFNLTRKDFHKAIEPYPELKARIRKLAQDRLQKTMRVMND